jgi:hypothetical protein
MTTLTLVRRIQARPGGRYRFRFRTLDGTEHECQ